jgi:hypothetical protein
MPAFHWVNNDAGYEKWLLSHPGGFMANLDKQPHARYFRIHRASHRLPDRSTPDSINPRTGTSYSKVTAEQISELVEWAAHNIPGIEFGAKNYCKTCEPNPDANVEAVPTKDVNQYISQAAHILARGQVARPKGVLRPKQTGSTVVQYFRDPKVRAWVLQRAKKCCELCNLPAPFMTLLADPPVTYV